MNTGVPGKDVKSSRYMNQTTFSRVSSVSSTVGDKT